MPNSLHALLASAAVLAASPSAAQPEASSDPPPAAPAYNSANMVAPVTVTARPARVIESQARSWVTHHVTTDHPEVGQIGRWFDPVCAQVVGLPREDQAAMIKARIESVAQAVGVPKARPNCRANVEVVFSDQPQRIMDVVADRHEFLLGYEHIHLRDQLKRVTHPIQSWYVTATRSDGGGAAAMMASNLSGRGQWRASVIDDPFNHPPNGCAASHFTSCLQSEFDNVFIVADSKALDGKDSGMVADYIVMLALSRPRTLDHCNAFPSVLDVFARPGCPERQAADGLTPADAAYLTSLYKADLRAKRVGEEGEIALNMARMLIKAKVVGR